MTTEKKAPPPKIPLAEWARSKFAKVPHVNTLRKWARDGHIKPAAEFVGREYLVSPNARYVAKTK